MIQECEEEMLAFIMGAQGFVASIELRQQNSGLLEPFSLVLSTRIELLGMLSI